MILHGLFLCVTSFVVGVILTWLFFAWRMDRDDNYMTDLLMRSYKENEKLTIESLENTKLIFKLETQAMQNIVVQQQEKEECPE